MFAALACLAAPGSLHAQAADSAHAAHEAAEREHPLVKSVTFNGVKNVDLEELKQRIATKTSRCRTFLLAPFCLLSKSHVIYQRNFLDRDELLRDELRVRVFYYKKGYRSSEVEARVVPPDADQVDIVFDVREGPPTVLSELSLEKTDTVEPPLPANVLQSVRAPAKGKPLDLFALDSAEVKLRNLLADRGYAGAEVKDTVMLSPDGLTAYAGIRLQPGEQVTVENVAIDGNERVSDRTISRMLTFHAGDLYRRSDLLESQRKMYESGLFRLATLGSMSRRPVVARGDDGGTTTAPAAQDTTRTVRVLVREAPLHGARISAGFNTVDFVQTELRYTDRNWLGGARRLEIDGVMGNLLANQLNGQGIFRDVTPGRLGPDEEATFLRPTWQGSIGLTQPYLGSPQNSLGLSVFAHRRTVPGIVVDRGVGAGISFTRRVASDIPVSLDYHFELNRLEAGGVYFCVNYGVCDQPTIAALRNRQRLSPLAFSIFTDRTDRALEPTSGSRLSLDIEHASTFTYSGFRYNRLEMEASRYLPRGGGRVIAGHLRYGFVRPLQSTGSAIGVQSVTGEALIHPRKRFYAGGSRSVRGYGENQLGPRVLTIPAAALLDTTNAGGCTIDDITAGTCDPNGVSSASFTPQPLGGDAVLEGSIEYRLPLTDRLLGALFVDAGAVGTDGLNPFAGGNAALTPGIGIRYRSKVGPVRVDLGWHPSGVDQLPVITQVQQPDGTFRLVRLETTKRFDPLEGSGGLGRTLKHLTLHLSIGEAF